MDFGDEKFRALPPPPSAASEREHMFEKVVTPSDVGKLNRLVIPKQHAEKYFPLDTAANEKGLLLTFEDRNGKPWRFRYSYWNSSQSYVMTKGWSRFVKEKRLDAGDTVSFGRCTSAPDRLFIDWKRRPDALSAASAAPYHHQHQILSFSRSPAAPWGGGGGNFFGIYGCNATGASASVSAAGAAVYFQSPVAPLPPPQVTVLESVPLVHHQAAAKRVRLFGVNLDCPESNEEDGYRGTQLRLGSGRASSSSPQQSSLDLDL